MKKTLLNSVELWFGFWLIFAMLLSGIMGCKSTSEKVDLSTESASSGEKYKENGGALPLSSPTPYLVELSQNGQSWNVRYRFATPQTALLFDTYHGNYRSLHWTPLASNTEIVDTGGLDGMFFSTPVREASFRVDVPNKFDKGTRPILCFSDDSSAFYSGQLALLTIESKAVALALRGNLGKWRGEQPPVVVRLLGSSSWVTDKGVEKDVVEVVAQNGRGPYVYSGLIPPSFPTGGVAVLDPGLPAWLKTRFASDLESVDILLTRRWGKEVGPSVAFLAWEGGAEPWQNVGRAENPQIAMSIRGKMYLEDNSSALEKLVWFFAHERVHHFQNESGIAIGRWPLEGAANTMATIVAFEKGLLNDESLQKRYAQVVKDCSRDLQQKPLEEARGPETYTCGDLISLSTIAIIPSHDLFGFWKRMLESAKREGAHVDGSYYFHALRKEADFSAVAALEEFVNSSHEHPKQSFVKMLRGVGIGVFLDDTGEISSIGVKGLFQ